MTWKRVKGCKGVVFVPDEPDPASRKHQCPDCYVCQHSSDERCHACLKRNRNTCCKPACRDNN
jgi:hypothetical protein